ncbi:MAG: hypothetical protein JXB13_15075 [Phycisphaerae bacterium]|nr:hypothetical protein [Phycisphaerae bacterium]
MSMALTPVGFTLLDFHKDGNECTAELMADAIGVLQHQDSPVQKPWPDR